MLLKELIGFDLYNRIRILKAHPLVLEFYNASAAELIERRCLHHLIVINYGPIGTDGLARDVYR